jgi:thiamine-monophosphate kinase
LSEFSIIKTISKIVQSDRLDVRQGIGDDAAILRTPLRSDLVVAMDTLVAGVHFPVLTQPYDVGWKALAVNLSDLAAMGADPSWATLALTLPKPDNTWVAEFARGFVALARQHQLALVGGDTTRGPLTITVQAHGWVKKNKGLLRSGAQVGDGIFVSGTLGDAAAGLCLALGQTKSGCPIKVNSIGVYHRKILLQRLNKPTPRVTLGQELNRVASAAIDVSDGLAQDLGHILQASDVGAVIEVAQLPASVALKRYVSQEQECRHLQLCGGDDYELCFTVSPAKQKHLKTIEKKTGVRITRIGHIVSGHQLMLVDAKGKKMRLPQQGYRHFS